VDRRETNKVKLKLNCPTIPLSLKNQSLVVRTKEVVLKRICKDLGTIGHQLTASVRRSQLCRNIFSDLPTWKVYRVGIN
jgi:hypothetical protein